MNKNVVIMAIVVLVLVAVGGLWYVKNSKTMPTNTMNTDPTTQTVNNSTSSPSTGSANSTDSAMTANMKEFTVTGSNFKFEPSTLTVNKGDVVKITFKNSGGSHDFVIDELNVHSDIIQSGKDATVEFTADKVGTFFYYCSVGNHRAMGMQGTITVK